MKTRILVDDVMLENTRPGQRHERGRSWTYYLFFWRLTRTKKNWITVRRFLETVEAPTRREANERLRRKVGRTRVLSDQESSELLSIYNGGAWGKKREVVGRYL